MRKSFLFVSLTKSPMMTIMVLFRAIYTDHITQIFNAYFRNNLYGWALMQPLPYDGFRWLERKEIDARLNAETIAAIADDAQIGYLLEVDLEYPIAIHDAHSDYPLAPGN